MQDYWNTYGKLVAFVGYSYRHNCKGQIVIPLVPYSSILCRLLFTLDPKLPGVVLRSRVRKFGTRYDGGDYGLFLSIRKDKSCILYCRETFSSHFLYPTHNDNSVYPLCALESRFSGSLYWTPRSSEVSKRMETDKERLYRLEEGVWHFTFSDE